MSAINLRLVEQQRVVSLQAIEQTQHGIHSSVSELPGDLQHQAMRPFVLLKERVSKSVSLHELVSLIKEADDEEDKVIELINRFSEQQMRAQQLQAEQARAQAASHAGVASPSQVQEPAAAASSGSSAQATVEKPVAKPQAAPKPAPKPIELVSPTELLGDNHLFIETEQDIDAYLGKLRSRLQQAIDGGKRVRIK